MTTKVFVGNLAFPTTDQALAEAFQDCGKVKSGVVITRGRRSLGYGFVEFESPDAAQHAVNTKNNTDLKGRTIKVELASDNPIRPERPPQGSPNSGGPSSSSGGDRGGAPMNRDPTSRSTANFSSGDSGVAPRRQRRMNRRRRNIKPQGDNIEVKGNNNPSGDRDPRDRDPRERDRDREPRGPKRDNNNNAGGGGGGGDRPNRGVDNRSGDNVRRRRRTNKNQTNEDRVLSTTAVFVANLPFDVKDDGLKAYFKEFNPQSAHVVVTRNGRSRGYGFVDFTGEKDQQNAINTKNKQNFNDREITVTPSYKTQEIAPENK
jgi:RNA recognition motif-containing protein